MQRLRRLVSGTRRSSVSRVLFAWLVPGLVLVVPACREVPAGPLNVVLISVDTLRRDHLSVYGYGRDTSPRLERLAREAVVFETAIAAHTNTGPSHASILTGLYPQSHGVTLNAVPIRPEVETLAHRLRSLGYKTAAFTSSWTLADKATGLGAGFDVYDDEVERHERKAADTWLRAQAWLERQSPETPLFLFFHLFDPHHPYRPPPQYWSRLAAGDQKMRASLDRRRENLAPGEIEEKVMRYDAEIAYADDHVRLLLEALDRLGIYERSLILFTSDHGETLDERPWRFDHGARVYEEQIRVPLIVRFPGGEHAGRRIRTPVHHVDILPTVLDRLGLPIPESCHGHSLMPLIQSENELPELASRPLFILARARPERLPELSLQKVNRKRLVRAIRVRSLKLIEYPSKPRPEFQLFDLAHDDGESRDLSAEQPDMVRKLRKEISRWHRAVKSEERDLPPLSPEAKEALRALGYL